MRFPSGDPIPADELLRQQLTTMRMTMAARAKQAMDALPAPEREALELWNAGVGYRGIADRTNRSPDDVGAVLARSRARLVRESDQLDG